MKVTGQHNFPVARERVWKALLDPAVLSRTVPGFERLEVRGESEFVGALTVQVGPVKGKFEGQVALSEIDPPNGYRMKMNGRGAPGFVTGEGRVRLAPAAGGTELTYDFDVQIGGRIASVGQRLLDTTSRAITKQALENLGKQLEVESATPAAATAAAAPGPQAASPEPPVDTPSTPPLASPPPTGPSQAQFAAAVAREVARELVPQWARIALTAAGVAVLALVGWWIYRSVTG